MGKNLNNPSKKSINRHLKICSTSLVIREIQIKTKSRYHRILIRMAIINKLTNSKCWWDCGIKGTLCTAGGIALWEILWGFLKKNKIRRTIWSEVPLLRIYLKKIKTWIQKKMHPYVYCSTISNSQDIEAN